MLSQPQRLHPTKTECQGFSEQYLTQPLWLARLHTLESTICQTNSLTLKSPSPFTFDASSMRRCKAAAAYTIDMEQMALRNIWPPPGMDSSHVGSTLPTGPTNLEMRFPPPLLALHDPCSKTLRFSCRPKGPKSPPNAVACLDLKESNNPVMSSKMPPRASACPH